MDTAKEYDVDSGTRAEEVDDVCLISYLEKS